jgi:hypothetical protein
MRKQNFQHRVIESTINNVEKFYSLRRGSVPFGSTNSAAEVSQDEPNKPRPRDTRQARGSRKSSCRS